MKYKHLPSALHNFGHSFVSLMNYVNDEYVVDVLERLAREDPRREVEIDFKNGLTDPRTVAENETVSKSMRYWHDWLPKRLASQGIEPVAILDLRLRFRITRMGNEVIVQAQDDRGKQHKVFIRTTL
jgi:hypothetical protein